MFWCMCLFYAIGGGDILQFLVKVPVLIHVYIAES